MILVTSLLLTTILLALFAVSAVFVLAEPQKLIHVTGTYTPSHPPAGNIVTNGGFETAPVPNTQGNWQVITSDSNHTGTIIQSPEAHSGTYSGAFTVSANPSGSGFVALSESCFYWAIGESYTLTFHYKSDLSSCYASVYAKSEQTMVGSDLANWVSGNLPATDIWTEGTLTFGPIPDGTVDLQIHFYPTDGVLGTLWLDDLLTDFSANSPSPPPTEAQNPTATPTASPSSTASPTPPGTADPTNTQNPTPTATASAPLADASPSPTPTTTQPTPTVAELTPLAIAAGLIFLSAFMLLSRRRVKHFGGAVVLIAVLLFTSMANGVYAQNNSPTDSAPQVISYSLWFTNGTAFPMDGSNANGYVNGGPFINVGGIHCIASGFGSSADKTASVVVLQNDGNVPLNISLALKNAVAPSNIQISMNNFFMNNQTYQPYCSNWMGVNNVGQNPLAPGQYMWLSITVSLGQTNVPLSGTPNYIFDYSFDLEVTATQA